MKVSALFSRQLSGLTTSNEDALIDRIDAQDNASELNSLTIDHTGMDEYECRTRRVSKKAAAWAAKSGECLTVVAVAPVAVVSIAELTDDALAIVSMCKDLRREVMRNIALELRVSVAAQIAEICSIANDCGVPAIHYASHLDSIRAIAR